MGQLQEFFHLFLGCKPFLIKINQLNSLPGRHRIGGQTGGIFEPPPKTLYLKRVLLMVLIREKIQNYVSIPTLIVSFNDKRWRRSGNISRLLSSIIFWRRRHLELNMDSFVDDYVPQDFSDITRKCVCLLILIIFLKSRCLGMTQPLMSLR